MASGFVIVGNRECWKGWITEMTIQCSHGIIIWLTITRGKPWVFKWPGYLHWANIHNDGIIQHNAVLSTARQYCWGVIQWVKTWLSRHEDLRERRTPLVCVYCSGKGGVMVGRGVWGSTGVWGSQRKRYHNGQASKKWQAHTQSAHTWSWSNMWWQREGGPGSDSHTEVITTFPLWPRECVLCY